jgi:hypothetical protein
VRDRARSRAENEAVFREANERQAEAVRPLVRDGLVPFICECHDERCFEVLQLTLDEYAAVRERPAYFVVVPDHGHPAERLVERRDRFDVVEKTDEADGPGA